MPPFVYSATKLKVPYKEHDNNFITDKCLYHLANPVEPANLLTKQFRLFSRDKAIYIQQTFNLFGPYSLPHCYNGMLYPFYLGCAEILVADTGNCPVTDRLASTMVRAGYPYWRVRWTFIPIDNYKVVYKCLSRRIWQWSMYYLTALTPLKGESHALFRPCDITASQ